MNRFTAELLGTFFLCLLATMGNPLAVALGLAALVWSLGPVSRAYFNPAITLSQRIQGAITTGWALLYLAAQLLGATAAALAGALIAGYDAERAEMAPMGAPDAWCATLAGELLGTLLLALVILGVANSRRTAGNSYAALAIGCVVYALSAAFGDVSATFNPAVTLAASLHDLLSALRAEHGIGKAFAIELIRFGKFAPWALCLLLAQLAGATLANACFRLTHPEDR